MRKSDEDNYAYQDGEFFFGYGEEVTYYWKITEEEDYQGSTTHD